MIPLGKSKESRSKPDPFGGFQVKNSRPRALVEEVAPQSAYFFFLSGA